MAKNLIICTGFDVFHGHEDRNASWEAVQLLPNTINFNGKSFKIKKEIVKVEYTAVDVIIPKLWDQSPSLVVHCGVSHLAKTVTLEACSYNLNYCKPDYGNRCLPQPKANLCQNGQGKEVLLTNLDVEKIAAELNDVDVDSSCCKKIVCSKDVGNYLCGYIYLKSLDIDQDRSLFIHVPKIEHLSAEKASEGILQVISKCLDQLSERKLLD